MKIGVESYVFCEKCAEIVHVAERSEGLVAKENVSLRLQQGSKSCQVGCGAGQRASCGLDEFFASAKQGAPWPRRLF